MHIFTVCFHIEYLECSVFCLFLVLTCGQHVQDYGSANQSWFQMRGEARWLRDKSIDEAMGSHLFNMKSTSVALWCSWNGSCILMCSHSVAECVRKSTLFEVSEAKWMDLDEHENWKLPIFEVFSSAMSFWIEESLFSQLQQVFLL